MSNVICRTFLLFSLALTTGVNVFAATEKNAYMELPNPMPINVRSWQNLKQEVNLSFATADVRYAKADVPWIKPQPTWSAVAWKGEKVHTQILLWTKKPLKDVRLSVEALTGAKGAKIAPTNITAAFVRYVMTDGLNAEGTGCRLPPTPKLDSSLSADAIDVRQSLSVEANAVQPIWLSVKVPQTTAAGLYKGVINVSVDGKSYKLPYTLTVKNRVLPEPSRWSYHLDLWQNPYSVARYYNVPLWSDAHFEAMRPYMKMLADAGQKTITVSMIYDPWRGQTYDIYDSMIKWIKCADGSWKYDYTIFDKWVAYMMSMGIDGLINCYTMVPWNNKFYYYDEALGRDTLVRAKTGTPKYAAHWKPMLQDFARHLRQKGWFDKTSIAMDERSLQDMQEVIRLVKQVDSKFKISLAGTYHGEIESDIYDYCVASAEYFPSDTLARRAQAGLPTTFYTYCMEARPNTFTFSPPAEATWMAWHAAAKGYSGYLRWAYNCWPLNPLQDSRYGKWSAGDTYFVYPGPMTSIRFERLVEGIQDYEKIKILKKEFAEKKQRENLRKLQQVLEMFEIKNLDKQPAGDMVNKAKVVLNGF